jgi:hypothetical protein
LRPRQRPAESVANRLTGPTGRAVRRHPVACEGRPFRALLGEPQSRAQAGAQEISEDVASLTGSFTIACECADTNCLEMIEISTDDYLAVRGEPRRFVVLPGHVIGDVETVLREGDTYAVVEKKETAAQVAELLAPESG